MTTYNEKTVLQHNITYIRRWNKGQLIFQMDKPE